MISKHALFDTHYAQVVHLNPLKSYAKDRPLSESINWLVIESSQNLLHDALAKDWFLDKSTKTLACQPASVELYLFLQMFAAAEAFHLR